MSCYSIALCTLAQSFLIDCIAQIPLLRYDATRTTRTRTVRVVRLAPVALACRVVLSDKRDTTRHDFFLCKNASMG